MYKAYVNRMNAASSAKERRAVIDEMCDTFAFSTAKAYKVPSLTLGPGLASAPTACACSTASGRSPTTGASTN